MIIQHANVVINCFVDINECSSKPCANGGTCNDAFSFFSCECAPGFSGVTCQSEFAFSITKYSSYILLLIS